jgi:hypothetical protein
MGNLVFHHGTEAGSCTNLDRFYPQGCGHSLCLKHLHLMVLKLSCLWRGDPGVESNERYYRRRAVEERMAAQRAVTETARAWHAKLAEDFAARAMSTVQAAVGA